MKYLGIDFGKKKIGLALGDDGSRLAFPHENIAGGDDAVERIVEFAKGEGVEALVVGIPIPTEAHQTDDQLNATMAFVNRLTTVSGLPVFVVDEQFSSAEARRVQKEMGATAPEDAIAAMLILQAYFDEGEDRS